MCADEMTNSVDPEVISMATDSEIYITCTAKKHEEFYYENLKTLLYIFPIRICILAHQGSNRCEPGHEKMGLMSYANNKSDQRLCCSLLR